MVEHVRMQSRCGACGFSFLSKDPRLTIRVSKHGSITRYSLIDTLFFTGDHRGGYWDDTFCCLGSPCSDCNKANETATIHLDCWQLYIANTPRAGRLSRLYQAARARQPWQNAPHLDIEPRCHAPSIMALAARLQLGALARLPWELQDAIAAELDANSNNNINNSPLFRFSAVLDLTETMSAAVIGSVPRLVPTRRDGTPVSLVQAWHRGTLPVLSKEPLTSPVLMTIDSMGIKTISRSQLPTHNAFPGQQAFITTIDNNWCLFQDGTCRIAPAQSIEERQQSIWNVPNPPSPQDCSKLPMALHRPTSAFAMDLSSCSGITFFIRGGVTRRIHAHTKAMPTALATFQQLPRRYRNVRWVYVPLPSADDLIVVGIRKENNSLSDRGESTYCFRTALTGDFTIGPWIARNWPVQYAYATSRQSTVVHSISDVNVGDAAAGFSYIFPQSSLCTDFQPFQPRSSRVPYDGSAPDCYSSAPLMGVCRVCIYRDRDSGSFQGLIFDYACGAQRALGSCRVGIDAVDRCEALADVRLRRAETSLEWGTKRPVVYIEICVASETEEEKDDWTRLEEGSTLEMWFDSRAMTLNMVPAGM